MVTLATYDDAREAFRSRHLRQALYDEGGRLMTGVIVNLHGDEHVARRRLENRLFRPDVFARYERDRIPAIIDRVLAPSLDAGRADLAPLARATMMTLSVGVAGVDGTHDGEHDIARLHDIMDRLARASTVAHATGDRAAIVDDGDAALDEFDRAFFRPSLHRRAALVQRLAKGEIDETDLPDDVLTTLLRNHDRLDLSPATVLREVAYFPWVGSHSTSNQFVHAMHHVFTWLAARPQDRTRLADDGTRQRFVHESLRLHPASPVAVRVAVEDVELRSGLRIGRGERVVIDVAAANRDPAAVGPDGERFDPHRPRADGVPPWGLSFGHGPHACLGRELAGGRPPDDDGADPALLGAITLLVGAVLAAGGRPDPHEPPTLDRSTTRHVWARYPVVFEPSP